MRRGILEYGEIIVVAISGYDRIYSAMNHNGHSIGLGNQLSKWKGER